MKIRHYILFFVLLVSCKEKELNYYELNQGRRIMEQMIEPKIINTKRLSLPLLPLNIKNSFGTIVMIGEFAVAEIKNDLSLEINSVVPGFTGEPHWRCGSDPQSNRLWFYRCRGFYSVDIESKDTAHLTVSYNPNDDILRAIVCDTEQPLFLICVVTNTFRSQDLKGKYLLYNAETKEILHTSEKMKATIHNYRPNLHLLQNQKDDLSPDWMMINNTFDNPITNKLTDLLNDKLITTDWPGIPINGKSRRLIGRQFRDKNYIHWSVWWDENFTDVHAEPFTIQVPKNADLNSFFTFSPDGKWLRTCIRQRYEKEKQLALFHVDSKYPQGISPPVAGGMSDPFTPHTFVDHEEFGPLYIELDKEQTSIMYVYFLNQVLEKLAGM